MNSDLYTRHFALAERLGEALGGRGMMLTTAESCTGGWVGEVLTGVPGSSQWFDRGFITYTNISKQEMLGVRAETLTQHGAVSEATVREMVTGALEHSRAQAALAISGIAGPGGGTPEKPVGTVCFGWGLREAEIRTERLHFDGDRRDVRAQSVAHAIAQMLAMIEAVRGDD